MEPKKAIIAGVIYQNAGGAYDGRAIYDCLTPAMTVDWDGCYIVDAWICDRNGNIHPGYSVSPVPVQIQNFGAVVGKAW